MLLLIFLLVLTIRTNAHVALAAESPRSEFEERRRAVAEMMEAATELDDDVYTSTFLDDDGDPALAGIEEFLDSME